MAERKIGVLAATPVDTGMGIDCVRGSDFAAAHTSRYLSATPAEQSNLQVLHKTRLSQLVTDACVDMAKEGADSVFLYCNSLAGAIDIEIVRQNSPIQIVTPLDVYKNLARDYRKAAVLAANCQSLAAIELVMQKANPGCAVYGSGVLPLVEAIESGDAPQKIMDDLKLVQLVQSLCAMGGDVLVLGCTHFPYLKAPIEAASSIPVVDPAQAMLQMLRE